MYITIFCGKCKGHKRKNIGCNHAYIGENRKYKQKNMNIITLIIEDMVQAAE